MNPRGAAYETAKRAMDVGVSAAVLAATAPLSAVIAWRIRRDGGPALYRGLRAGRGGTTFHILKFRTMVVDAAQLGGDSTSNDDPRVTSTGRFLRRWKLDELPQFLNVLRGDMSLVGPRPQVLWDVERYTEEERRLLEVRPGITDWASIRYRTEGEILAGSPDADLAYDELIRPGKIALGLAYVRHRSMAVDLRILKLTALGVLGHPGTDAMLERMVRSTGAHV
jgi:lipopolysaccharide/colanic/teichoic acid biosynthesis glycosyltransferase